MLIWILILAPTFLLAGLLWWLRPMSVESRTPHMEQAESRLIRLLALFEDELQRSEGASEVVGLSSDGKALILCFGHQESVLSLPDLLRFAKVRGHQLHELVKDLVEFLQENQSSVDDLPFDLAIPDLLPQIRTMEWIQANSPAFGSGRLLRSPLIDELKVCYVIDEAETMVFLTEAHLAAWGASPAAIHNLALKNLANREVETAVALADSLIGAELQVIERGDGYSATRVLLWLDSVGDADKLVFGIPERDKLYVGNALELNADWLRRLSDDFDGGRHPLSPRFFRVEARSLVVVDS